MPDTVQRDCVSYAATFFGGLNIRVSGVGHLFIYGGLLYRLVSVPCRPAPPAALERSTRRVLRVAVSPFRPRRRPPLPAVSEDWGDPSRDSGTTTRISVVSPTG